MKFFSTHFTESFSLFLSLTLLSSIVDVIAWITYGDPVFALYLGLHGYLMCYLLVLLYNAIKIRRIKYDRNCDSKRNSRLALNILLFVNNVCKENNIKYLLGSELHWVLLGTHKYLSQLYRDYLTPHPKKKQSNYHTFKAYKK